MVKERVMKGAVVKFSNGYSFRTSINGTDAEIKKYYMGKYFDIGVYPKEKMAKVVSVRVLKDDSVKKKRGTFAKKRIVKKSCKRK